MRITEKCPRINIFKISGAYYFKYFFGDPGIFRELLPYYQRYRFRVATSGECNKVMELLKRNGYDPVLIEDPAPFTVEIGRYRKYGELLKNSVENYPMRDRVVLIMKDLAWVEQAVAMGAAVKGPYAQSGT